MHHDKFALYFACKTSNQRHSDQLESKQKDFEVELHELIFQESSLL